MPIGGRPWSSTLGESVCSLHANYRNDCYHGYQAKLSTQICFKCCNIQRAFRHESRVALAFAAFADFSLLWCISGSAWLPGSSHDSPSKSLQDARRIRELVWAHLNKLWVRFCAPSSCFYRQDNTFRPVLTTTGTLCLANENH